jgi:Ca2+-binding EF-hand superfamily protein
VIENISEHNTLRVEDMNARRKARFEKLDTDNSGALSAEEIETLVNRIEENRNVSFNLEAFAAELDKDGSGSVSFEEFGDLRKVIDLPRSSRMPWGRKERFFSRLDADNSGGVSESELTDLITNVNKHRNTSLVTEEGMTALDSNDSNGYPNNRETEK